MKNNNIVQYYNVLWHMATVVAGMTRRRGAGHGTVRPVIYHGLSIRFGVTDECRIGLNAFYDCYTIPLFALSYASPLGLHLIH